MARSAGKAALCPLVSVLGAPSKSCSRDLFASLQSQKCFDCTCVALIHLHRSSSCSSRWRYPSRRNSPCRTKTLVKLQLQGGTHWVPTKELLPGSTAVALALACFTASLRPKRCKVSAAMRAHRASRSDPSALCMP